jgi:ubiquinone biosynthesis protein UbiJ
MKNKQSKEIKQIQKAVAAYIAKHEGNCIINFSMAAFNEENDVIEDQLWLFGDKETLKTNNECMLEEIENLDN